MKENLKLFKLSKEHMIYVDRFAEEQSYVV